MKKPTAMKKIISLITAALILSACGGGGQNSVKDLIAQGDLEAIRAKKTEISEKHKALETELKQLDSAIARFGGNENLPLVTTITAEAQKFDHFLELQGNVQTKQNVLIYPEMSGTLQKVYVKEGQRVSKGQLLALIDDGGMGSQLVQLKTRAALEKTTFERQQCLWDQKIGSEKQ
jgi:multidrug efflux pump subunit AcrA (membrane-fusion protein)